MVDATALVRFHQKTHKIHLYISVYNGTPSNYYSRVIASEVDVKSLIWLSRIGFYA